MHQTQCLSSFVCRVSVAIYSSLGAECQSDKNGQLVRRFWRALSLLERIYIQTKRQVLPINKHQSDRDRRLDGKIIGGKVVKRQRIAFLNGRSN